MVKPFITSLVVVHCFVSTLIYFHSLFSLSGLRFRSQIGSGATRAGMRSISHVYLLNKPFSPRALNLFSTPGFCLYGKCNYLQVLEDCQDVISLYCSDVESISAALPERMDKLPSSSKAGKWKWCGEEICQLPSVIDVRLSPNCDY